MEKAPGQLELMLRYFADFSPAQLTQLAALQDLYKEWNEKINVISRKDIDSLYERHILHSLAIAAAFRLEKGMQVIDIGTGGGFPGIPLAIFFPDTQFHLVDSIGKKIKVVQAVQEAIGLTNITTAHTRAEDIKNRKFDVVVSRAVAPLKDLWTWGRPLLKKAPRRGTAARQQSIGDPAPPPQHQPGNPANPQQSLTDPQSFHPPATTPQQESPSDDLPVPNGLICLKGGDLAAEISDSALRPRIMEIFEIFDEEYFKEKYLLYVPF